MTRPWKLTDEVPELVQWRKWLMDELNRRGGSPFDTGLVIDDSLSEASAYDALFALMCSLADGPDVHRQGMWGVERTKENGEVSIHAVERSESAADKIQLLVEYTTPNSKWKTIQGEFTWPKT
jgi:hypothetical protein